MTTGAVIFDCDGVLVNSEAICQKIEIDCLAEIGLIFEPRKYSDRFLGSGRDEYCAALDEEHQRRLGRPLPTSVFTTMYERSWVALDLKLAAVAGVEAAVRSINAPIAVASGSSESSLAKKLSRVGLHDLFAPHIYSADLVERGKPAPDIFLYAARRLGVAAEKCIAVEDSINGILSAVSAGMITVGFTGRGHCGAGHRGRLKNAGAAHVIDHMDQLLPLLGEIA